MHVIGLFYRYIDKYSFSILYRLCRSYIFFTLTSPTRSWHHCTFESLQVLVLLQWRQHADFRPWWVFLLTRSEMKCWWATENNFVESIFLDVAMSLDFFMSESFCVWNWFFDVFELFWTQQWKNITVCIIWLMCERVHPTLDRHPTLVVTFVYEHVMFSFLIAYR